MNGRLDKSIVPPTTTNTPPVRGTQRNHPDYDRIRNALSPAVAKEPVGLAYQLERGASDRVKY